MLLYWNEMSHWCRRPLGTLLIVLCCAASYRVSAEVLPPSPEAWSELRVSYQKAAAELDSGAGSRYEAIRATLDDYPLRLDLDFAVKLGQLHDMTAAEAAAFMDEARGTPLSGRFLVAYLRHKAQDRRWRAFLDVLDSPPDMPELQCYYYRALYGVDEKERAFAGAALLWNVGVSQDDACDPLFKVWIKQGGLDDGVIWSRAIKAFTAKNGHLIRYVKRFASNALQADLDELAAIYRRPSRVEGDHHPDSSRHTDILVAGVKRLAQLNPSRAYEAFASLREHHAFSDAQLRDISSAIVRHSLFAERTAVSPDWVSGQVSELQDDELTLIWLRNAIAEGDWAAVLRGIGLLSGTVRAQDRWRYWRAHSLDELGEEGATAEWTRLAGSRSFHGFIAAERLGLPYQLNSVAGASAAPPLDATVLLGVGRTQELLALGKARDAKEQWRHTLNQQPVNRRSALGDVALSRDWPDLATDAANSGVAWDRLDLRFPKRYWAEFQSAAEMEDVDAYQLIALARRESSLYPMAKSEVGARGLMQVMPATARGVAKRRGDTYRGASSLYDPQLNIVLGSAYYAELLRRYDGNRIKALAAYNAGPSRVDRWASGSLAPDQWVDSLPFAETREYVQAVLAYTVIYRVLSGKPAHLMTQSEAEATY